MRLFEATRIPIPTLIEPAIACGLIALLLLPLWPCGAGARETPSGALPDPHGLGRNNRGELSYWHHGNVIGRALIEFDDLLYVGGGFTHAGGIEAPAAACWDGASWMPASSEDLDGWVYAFAEFRQMLYAGGHFQHCGAVETPHIARLDLGGSGAWEPLAGETLDGDLFALTVHDDGAGPMLIAGGSFTAAGGTPLNGVGGWNGANWSPLGDGFTWEVEPGVFLPGIVYALHVFEDQLYAGGAFTHSGATEVGHFARWNGASWEPVDGGFDAPVMAIGEYAGELVAGGHFVVAGDEVVFHLAHLGEGQWQPFGWGTNGGVFAITNFRNQLIVGGEFNEAGGLDCSYVAGWNGYDWYPLGPGVDDNRVYGLGLYDGQLYATGGFITSHAELVNRIARWDQPLWFALDEGLEGTILEPLGPDGESPFHSLGGNGATVPGAARADEVRLAVRPLGDGGYALRYSLPADGWISLDLIDAAGRRLSRIAEGVREGGSHELRWRPDLDTGVYFLRLGSPAGCQGSRLLIVE
ncbi:MAG: hypothetical protein GF330_00640 [Candidatus Eisenbacteria bacterium]|nr:hypothetical protein [Candidatus Eisenbacteria bacterium]